MEDFSIKVPSIVARRLVTIDVQHQPDPVAIEGNDLYAQHARSYVGSPGNNWKIYLSSNKTISARAFQTWLAIQHLSSTMAMKDIYNGIVFKSADLKKLMKLSNSGYNSKRLIEDIRELETTEFCVFGRDEQTMEEVQLTSFCLLEGFEYTSSELQYNSRYWHIRFSQACLNFLDSITRSSISFSEIKLNNYEAVAIAVNFASHLSLKEIYPKSLVRVFSHYDPNLLLRYATSSRVRRNFKKKVTRIINAVNHKICDLKATISWRSMSLVFTHAKRD